MGLYQSAPGRIGTQLIEEPDRLPIEDSIETLNLVSPRHARKEVWQTN
jgi:hypothetical protein